MATTVTLSQFEILKVVHDPGRVLTDFMLNPEHIPEAKSNKEIPSQHFPCYYSDLNIIMAGYCLLNERWYAVIRTNDFDPDTYILKPLSKKGKNVLFVVDHLDEEKIKTELDLPLPLICFLL